MRDASIVGGAGVFGRSTGGNRYVDITIAGVFGAWGAGRKKTIPCSRFGPQKEVKVVKSNDILRNRLKEKVSERPTPASFHGALRAP